MGVTGETTDELLLPELAAVLQLTCNQAGLVFHAEQPWASLSFSGKRHTIGLDFKGAEAIAYGEAFIDCLPDYEFALAGKLVADAAIVFVDRRRGTKDDPVRTTVTIELLVLDDA